MSNPTYRAQPLSRKSIRRYTQYIRKTLHLENEKFIDVLWILEHVLPALFPDFHFEVLPMSEMGANHGLTDPLGGTIFLREDVYEGASRGVGRDRLTVAHEIGHFLLHNDVSLCFARNRSGTPIPPFCDPEWQASAFAGELLMDHDLIQTMTIDEIVQECGVSYDAARYQKSKK